MPTYDVTHALKYLPDRTDWIQMLITGGHLHFRSVGNTGDSEVVVPITKLQWGNSVSLGTYSIGMGFADPDNEITTDFVFRMAIGSYGIPSPCAALRSTGRHPPPACRRSNDRLYATTRARRRRGRRRRCSVACTACTTPPCAAPAPLGRRPTTDPHR